MLTPFARFFHHSQMYGLEFHEIAVPALAREQPFSWASVWISMECKDFWPHLMTPIKLGEGKF
jgi:hypothetical protein